MPKTQTKKAAPVKSNKKITKSRTPRGGLPGESSAPAPVATTVDKAVTTTGILANRFVTGTVEVITQGKATELTPQVIEEKALTLPDRARSVVITDKATFAVATDLVKDVVAIRKEITDHYAPLKEAAFKAHRLVCDAESKVLSPVAEAEKILKQAIGFYTTEQQRLDNERRRKAQEEDDARRQQEVDRARLDAEEKSAAEIERLVLYEGFTLEDAMMRVNPQARVQQAMESVPVARTVIQPTLPKVQGMPTVAPTYKVDVYDLKELCGAVYRGEYSTECILPNMPTLNSLARTLKEGFKMPGCRLEKGETVTVR